jgi:hypothetical protein
VKIYLLLIDHERHFFYSDIDDEPEFDEHEPPESTREHSGLRAWAQRQLKKLQDEWNHANHGPMQWMRRLWDWLHSFSHPDEAMLARLRTAKRIHLHHPASLAEEKVNEIWYGYLGQQWRRHWAWLAINGTVAPFTIPLALLPGPNVIGFWFLYRTIHHAAVVWGLSRVRRGVIETEYHAVEQLDVPVSHDPSGKTSHPALRSEASDLGDHVARQRSSR